MLDDDYYNGASVLNADCPISFVLGNRSSGKSFYWKRYCIRQWLDKHKQFIYIRRNENDLQIGLSAFWDDIAFKFPGYGMQAKGNIISLYEATGDPEDKPELTTIGYAYSLNNIKKIKSIPFPDVTTIFFDEFIPDDNAYLKPAEPSFEPERLLSLYMTVARGKHKAIREDVMMICVSNTVTRFSPYFAYFNINLVSQNKTIQNNVYAEINTNTKARDEIKKSKFGKILENTSYGAYALENIPIADCTRRIANPPQGARAIFEIYAFTWYICFYTPGGLYFKEAYDKTLKYQYKFSELPGDTTLPWFKGEIVKICKSMYNADLIYYSSARAKAIIASILA